MVYKRKPEVVEHESRVVSAVAALKRDRNLSVNRVAKTFDVPRSTLRGRAKGGKSRQEGREIIRALSSVEESELVKYISRLSCTGFMPKHDLI